jgi:hypothetical protein
MGVNNFFVNSQFGSISTQYSDIKSNIKLNYVRVLFAWTTEVQPTPNSPINYSFFDNILAGAPAGVDVLVVLSHTPSWMANSANWIGGNPRVTWIEKWLKPTINRYAGHGRIIGWEVWNEPDLVTVASDAPMDLVNPANYMELLSLGSSYIRQRDPAKLVLNAATSSIQQNYPTLLNYNKDLRDMGAVGLVDIWNVHYYGNQFERVVKGGGVADFLNGLTVPIWITESGAQGPNNQLSYVETAWPFLREKIPGIDRIYYFELNSPQEISVNFGMRTTNPQFPVSDLYIFLRDR